MVLQHIRCFNACFTPCRHIAQENDDASRDSGERDERRLAELGRAAVQTYVVAHIFLEKLAAAHGEVESLRRQEALIEEEERGEAEAETRCEHMQPCSNGSHRCLQWLITGCF